VAKEVGKPKRNAGRRQTRRSRVPTHRLEKLMVFYDEKEEEWRVRPGTKALSPGQEVMWQAFDCDSFELALPDVFEDTEPEACEVAGGKSKIWRSVATVRHDAEPGVYTYQALCDGDEAEGDSDPKVIIDP
jgi:hypothetical protein